MIIISVVTAVRDHTFILETLRHADVSGRLYSSSSKEKLSLENLTATLSLHING